MQLTLVATGSGRVRQPGPTLPVSSSPGIAQGTRAVQVGQAGDADARKEPGETRTGRRGAPRAKSPPGHPDSRGASARRRVSVVLARPLVPKARPAVVAERRARPSDTKHAEQEVHQTLRALVHASTAARERGKGAGGEHGPEAIGLGGSDGNGSESIFPTIFGVLRAQHPDARIASIYDWGGFGRLYEKSAVNVDIDGDGPDDTMKQALAVIQEEFPNLTFIHLDHVDGAGHEFGHGSDEY
jgi:hypothetical protein